MPYAPSPDLTDYLVQVAKTGGGTVRLAAGGSYRADFAQLPEVVRDLHLDGNGALLEIVGASATPGATRWEDCLFERVRFTAPKLLNPNCPFSGYASVRNTFRDNTFVDYAPSVIFQHGRGLTFERNRFLQSDQPPPVMYSNIFCPLGDLLFRGNEMNFAPGGPPGKTATGILVGASGPTTTGQRFENWWITDNRFLDADRPGFAIDTIVDIEAGNPAQRTTLKNVWVERNVCYNGKIDYNSGDNVWVRDNDWHITKNAPPGDGQQAAMFYMIGTGGQPGGCVRLEGNVYVQEPDAPMGTKAQAIQLTPQVYLRELTVRGNTFILNGAGKTPEPPGVIGIRLKPDSPAGVMIDSVDIADNLFGFTSVPANPGPLIAFTSAATAPGVAVHRLSVQRNRVLGATRAGVLPATVGGAVLKQFLRVGAPNGGVELHRLELIDNRADEVQLAGRMLAIPVPIPNLLQQVRGNTPAPEPSGPAP